MMAARRWELGLGDPAYPALLRETADPPDALHGFGDPALLGPSLAVVGARRATPYGIACARRFAGWAAAHGVTVVSGAAIGCDLQAQQAALAAGGRTVSVLGCGADVDYPRRARGLLATLRESHAVVAEAPWGAPPQRWAFTRRNRIIAGLASAVLVVEAGLPSGTFSTADFALAAGRDVLAVPGSILSPECRGSNRLIAQGATPITDESELRDALLACGLAVHALNGSADPDSGHPDATDQVLRALRADAMHPDDLAFALHLDIVTLARRLAFLEAEGLVARYADGRFGAT